MRTIKFRGQKKNIGEWVEGGIYEENGTFYIRRKTDFPNNVYFSYAVELETVGQFTGLKDKNGVEIYEGDIVVYPEDNKPCEVIYRVSDYGASFNTDSHDGVHSLGDVMRIVEVIGNIHDNPELLK